MIFIQWKNSMNNKNGKTQLSDLRFDECTLHQSSSVGYLGNNQSCSYDNFKETLPHFPCTWVYFSRPRIVCWLLFLFFLTPLIFTHLVTWETLVLNWFCGIVGKGKLLIPFYVFNRRARKRWVAFYSCIKFLVNYLFEVILPTFCSSLQ